MGSYLTTTSILSIIPGLPQTSSSAGYSATAAVVDRQITRAEGYVNGKLAQRYEVPFTSTSVPPLVVTLTEDIATFYCFRSFFTQDNQNYSGYLDNFKDANDTLKEIQKGDIDLIDPSGNLVSEREISAGSDDADISSNVTDKQPFFDVDDAEDWDFNSDLLDDIRDKR